MRVLIGIAASIFLTGSVQAGNPTLAGHWVLTTGFNNVGSVPESDDEVISQTDSELTIIRTRDGARNVVRVNLGGALSINGDGSSDRAHWTGESLIVDYTSVASGVTTHIQEAYALMNHGSTLSIYRKGPQTARLYLFLAKQ